MIQMSGSNQNKRLLYVLLLVFWSNQGDATAEPGRQQPTPLKTCVGRPKAETCQGPICGTHCPDGPVEVCGEKGYVIKPRKYRAFCGIPYAKPPIGALRFKRPVPGEPWNDYRDGSWMPPGCPQFNILDIAEGKENISTVGQEDCLFLNVYVPKIAAPVTYLPVMVFIHGGSFTWGDIKNYFADKLMTRDIILVTIQYRLGILGFFSTGDEVAAGNLALKDQELSLRWIQDNIAHFGGDPSMVTIFGESAGGASVHAQLINPQAKGLFSRAILQSGTAFLLENLLPMNHQENAFQLATRLGCNIENEGYGHRSEVLLKCLQEVPAMSFVTIIASFFEWGNLPYAWSPRIGETSLPGAPSQLFRDGKYHMVDIMMGINEHEGGYIAKEFYIMPNAFQDIATNFLNIGHLLFTLPKHEKDAARQMFQYYLGGIREYTEDDADGLTEMFGDYYHNIPHDYSIELHARDALYGKNIYAYELKHKGDEGLISLMAPHIGKDYVNHGDDLFYLFKFSPNLDSNNPETKKLESIMLDLWTNFATHG
ncbi:unnamed protein product, partial [Meganyctiphanes norvegica]